MPNAFPGLVQFALIPQPQFIANGQPNFSALQFGKTKPSNALLIQTQVPTNGDVGLCLTFFQPLVIISFDLDERAEDILVLISVLVTYEDRLRFVVHTWFLEVLEGCVGILAPEVFEAVDLGERDLAGSKLLGFARRFDKPREERTVVNERCPKGGIP